MSPFAGRCIVVTGAASGIGRATLEAFAAEGAAVVAADRTEDVHTVASGIVDRGGRAIAETLDAGDEAAVERLMRRAVDSFGRLDVVHANAGVSGGIAGIFEQTAQDWRDILGVNLVGAFLAIKYAARLMEPGGSIICTASIAGLLSGAGGPAYSASKAGVVSLVKVAAQQLTGTGIRVNAVCPGLIETGMTRSIFDHARSVGKEDRLGRLNPLRRGGHPGEIAEAVLFLASDAASYVNGHALVVDGGLTSSMPVTRQETGKTAL